VCPCGWVGASGWVGGGWMCVFLCGGDTIVGVCMLSCRRVGYVIGCRLMGACARAHTRAHVFL